VDRLRALYGALCILFTRRQRGEGLKEMTFYSWLRRRGQSERAIENLWNLIVLPTLNEDVYRASADWGIMVFQEALLKGAHNADIGYSQVGLGSLVSSAATSYIESRGGKVITGQGVRSLEVKDSGVDGAVLVDGTVLKADLYLSSLPADSALGLLPEAWREDDFFKLALEISWSPIVNVYIRYDRQVMDAPFAAFLGSEAQWVFNRSQIQGEGESYGQRLGVSLSGAWKYIGMSRAELEELFVSELSDLFPAAREAKVLSFAVVKQRRATFSATPGGDGARLSHRTPIANFFLAGDWTDTGWPSTMEGAVRSGVNAASEIIRLYNR
jgi:squalene-associated FAD-dependent desaturase